MKTGNEKSIPSQLQVTHYFFKMGLEVKHAEAFFHYYGLLNWQISPGRPVKNWKSLAFNWVCSFQKAKPIRKQSIHH